MNLSHVQKQFILDNMKLIRDYNFDEFYEKWGSKAQTEIIDISSTGEFITYFHKKGILIENFISKIFPFMYANQSVQNIIIPNHVHVLCDRAFFNSVVLTPSIVIPETVTSIGNKCFECSTIREVTIKGNPSFSGTTFKRSHLEIVNVTDNYFYEKMYRYVTDRDFKLNYIT